MTSLYPKEFYDRISTGSVRSAQIILPSLVERFEVESAVDIGCGSAAWLSVLEERGITDVLGVDGLWAAGETLMIGADKFVECDLSTSLPQIERRFDLALSTEVAEHLPPETSEGLVNLLCDLSDVVVFSAAIPHQGGIGHVNQNWPSFWAEHFRRRGYGVLDIVRPTVWTNDDVNFWYRQNLLVYVKGAEDDVSMIDVVHPAMVDRGLSRQRSAAEIFVRRQLGTVRKTVKSVLRR